MSGARSTGAIRRGALFAAALVLSACAPVPPADDPRPPGEPAEPIEAPAQEDTGDRPVGDRVDPPPRPEPDAGAPEKTAPEERAPEAPPEPAAEPEPAEPIEDTAEPETGSPPSEPAAPEVADTGPSQAEASKPAEPARVEIAGRIRLDDDDADPAQAVITFQPEAGAPAPEPGGPLEIVTKGKALHPTVMVAPAGSTLRFPNEDPILHNLFSVSPGNDFDVGVYGPDTVPTTVFGQPGVVDVFCNVHHDMHAHVLVVDTPYYTRADADGAFHLAGLPPTRGELRVWHRQTEGWSRRVSLPTDNPLTIELTVTRPSLPPHRDKRGQSYQRRDDDRYR